MYYEYYGLQADPFTLNTTANSSYHHPGYLKARSYLQYALHKKEGIVVLTAEPGMGKTTLVNELSEELSASSVSITTLSCSSFDADDLLRFVARGFGIQLTGGSKFAMISCIEAALLDIIQNQQRHPLLLLDEAQTLPVEALEQVRLLTNLRWNNVPLLQVFLVGQAGLRDNVLSEGMEQLHQRIMASANLLPLERADVGLYVKHRLKLVGWSEVELKEVLSGNATGAAAATSINLVMSRLLLHGMVEEKKTLGLEELRNVLQELVNEELLPHAVRAQIRANAAAAASRKSH